MLNDFLDYLPSGLESISQLLIAYLLSLPIALERSQVKRNAGLRTFPIVAMVSCAFVLVGNGITEDETSTARVIYGVVTGIGFIGGGAIIKYKTDVLGTATAACIWCAGAIGVAVAMRQLDIALFLMIASAISLVLLSRKDDSDGTSSGETG